jgi:hypothetical protein
MAGGTEKRVICPGCGKEVGMEHFACISGSVGGASGVGAVKARSTEQARAAAEARWGKGLVVDDAVKRLREMRAREVEKRKGCIEVGDGYAGE